MTFTLTLLLSHTLALPHPHRPGISRVATTGAIVAELDLPSGPTLQLSGTQMKYGFNWLGDDSSEDDLHQFGYAELVTE